MSGKSSSICKGFQEFQRRNIKRDYYKTLWVGSRLGLTGNLVRIQFNPHRAENFRMGYP